LQKVGLGQAGVVLDLLFHPARVDDRSGAFGQMEVVEGPESRLAVCACPGAYPAPGDAFPVIGRTVAADGAAELVRPWWETEDGEVAERVRRQRPGD
jgi:hypothetical protein